MGYRVAVVGATGNVGREMMQVLAEREFPCDEVAAVASSRSVGTEVEFGDTGKMLKCQNIEHFDWAGWDIALFAVGSEATKIYAPKAAAAGCVVIDTTCGFLVRWQRDGGGDDEVPSGGGEVLRSAQVGTRVSRR